MKFCVIGLGRFGYELATTLVENGIEVLGIDSDETIVASIRDLITQAVCAQVTNENALRALGVDEMDTVIVAMGEHFSETILLTALLKKRLGIPRVIARAVDEIHKEILLLVGADRVILPEVEIGKKLAHNLSFRFKDAIRLSSHYFIAHIVAPASLVGRSLEELNLFYEYNVQCIGIKKEDDIFPVQTDHLIAPNDKLVLVGKDTDIATIERLP